MKNLKDKINESNMSPEALADKFESMKTAIGGPEKLLDEIFQWFETKDMQECLEDIDSTWDLGVF